MALTIHVESYNNHAPVNASSVTVNESGCTIGRATDNSFVLPDVERIISHRHATIQFENGTYYLIDNSTNGTYINHAPEPVGRDNKTPLHDGDVLSIGKYDCVISMDKQEKPAADYLLSDALLHPPYHSEAQQPSWEKEPYHEPAAPTSPQPSENPSLAVEQDYFRPPEAIPEDWDVLTGMKPEKTSQAAPIIPEPVMESEVQQSQPLPSQSLSQKVRAEQPKAKAQGNVRHITNLDQQALNAFLEGAGLTHATIKPEEIVSFMNTAGQVVRELTQGFRQVLDARTNIKGEFRLGMTTLRPAENNPLKFSIDVEDALTKLLLPPPKGYLPPIEAIHEATDDLQAHQIALLAGLRAALSSLVALFDPEALEKNFQKASAVDNLLPALKKAKYWEMFKSRYKQAAADAENDFLHFLGDEFTIAYEQQVQRLKSVRHKDKV